MIKYALDIPVSPIANQLEFDDSMAFLGSCFTEHIGQRLAESHFQTFINPNGIVFNPVSLAEPFRRIAKDSSYTKDDLYCRNNQWVSLCHHSRYSSDSQEDVLENINQLHVEFKSFITTAKCLFVTFGTAWVYEFIEKNSIVANCHKIPQSKFSKRLLSVNEIVECWRIVISQLKILNPSLAIIFTISPVRHLRDGVHENNLSKATLLLAIEQLLDNKCIYFPAYELVVDDLRDYRFFESDGAHPNKMAIDYVFDKFRFSILSKDCNEAMDAIDKFYKLKNHRPLSMAKANISELEERLNVLRNELNIKYSRLKNAGL